MCKQCKSKEFIKEVRCQGVPKHTGPHWAYSEDGSLIQWRNSRDKSPKWRNIASRWIPPEHKNWISPVDMQKMYYLKVWFRKRLTK